MKNIAVCLQIDPESYELGLSESSVDLWCLIKSKYLNSELVVILLIYTSKWNVHATLYMNFVIFFYFYNISLL